TRTGDLFFAAAMGLYPNRRVMDAAFSVLHDGRQLSVRASRLAPVERAETRVGPIVVEVVEPLRVLRVRVDANPHGIEADVTFSAGGPVIEEPRFRYKPEGRVVMDLTRLTQFGTWSGTIRAGGRTHALADDRVLGCRDRSWGVRPIGEPETGAPGMPPQFFWLWSPVHFDDVCTHFDVNEDGDGRRWHANGMLVPVGTDDPGRTEIMTSIGHRIRWRSG